MGSILATVATFSTLIEAQLAKSKLQSEGIEAFIVGEHVSIIQPLYSTALGGMPLQVYAEDRLAAERILQRDERLLEDDDE